MGPVALAVPVVAGVIAISQDTNDDHVQIADQHLSTTNIGGTLKNVKRVAQYRENQIVAISNLDQFLLERSVPANTIQEAQKLKISKIGIVQQVSFFVTDNQFVGRVSVIKGRKIDANNIQLLFYSDIIEAEYVPAQKQIMMSQSGTSYSTRPLELPETRALTQAVSQKAIELKNEWRAIEV